MKKIGLKRYIWTIAVIVLLIFLHFTSILAPVESLVVNTFKPLFVGFYSVGSYFRVAYNKQINKRDLIQVSKQLKNRVSELTVENARLKVLEEENQVLRQYLKFSKKEKTFFILGNIVARARVNSSNADLNVVIDKGVRDGVEVGAGVISSKGVIIGKIVGVKEYLSEICLITNRDCAIAATLQNKDKTSGIIKGELGLTIKMEFIPQTEEIKAGDTVITSGLERNIPRGLVIGRVVQVDRESNELWQSAVIEPLVDSGELTVVSVLDNNSNSSLD